MVERNSSTKQSMLVFKMHEFCHFDMAVVQVVKWTPLHSYIKCLVQIQIFFDGVQFLDKQAFPNQIPAALLWLLQLKSLLLAKFSLYTHTIYTTNPYEEFNSIYDILHKDFSKTVWII